MELHQLRYLVAVADQGSFTAAAAHLHVSQSGVSAQVAKFEHEIGHRLLDRRGRTVALTDAGQSILPHARAALSAVATITRVGDELSGLVRGSLRLGTVIGCTMPGYLSGFAAFRDIYPAVSVSVVEGDSDRLVADLLSGRLDLALVAHARPLPDGLSAQTIVREPLTALVRRDHSWAARTEVSCTDLSTATVLTLPVGTGVHAALDTMCARSGVRVTPAVAAHSPDSVLALVALGNDVGVLTATMAAGHDDLVCLPITESVETSLSLAVGPAPSAATRAMNAMLADRLIPAR